MINTKKIFQTLGLIQTNSIICSGIYGQEGFSPCLTIPPYKALLSLNKVILSVSLSSKNLPNNAPIVNGTATTKYSSVIPKSACLAAIVEQI